MSLVWSCQ